MLIEPLRLGRKQIIVRNLWENTTSGSTEIPNRNTQYKAAILALYDLGALSLASTQAFIIAFGVEDA